MLPRWYCRDLSLLKNTTGIQWHMYGHIGSITPKRSLRLLCNSVWVSEFSSLFIHLQMPPTPPHPCFAAFFWPSEPAHVHPIPAGRQLETRRKSLGFRWASSTASLFSRVHLRVSPRSCFQCSPACFPSRPCAVTPQPRRRCRLSLALPGAENNMGYCYCCGGVHAVVLAVHFCVLIDFCRCYS